MTHALWTLCSALYLPFVRHDPAWIDCSPATLTEVVLAMRGCDRSPWWCEVIISPDRSVVRLEYSIGGVKR